MNDNIDYFIYVKYENQKRFKPMDLKNNVQVTYKIHATRLSKEEAEKLMEKDAKINPNWQFEIRRAFK